MPLRRVKQVSQLHAPRVRFVYIKPIPRPRKWRIVALLPKRRRETIQSFLPGYGVSRMMVPGETGRAAFAVRSMAGATGLEPVTCGFGDRRSTN